MADDIAGEFPLTWKFEFYAADVMIILKHNHGAGWGVDARWGEG